MNNQIDRLLAKRVSFLADAGPDEDIAISSRIRLARNLADHRFPVSADAEELHEICNAVSSAAADSGALGCPECFSFDPEKLDELDREFLLERRLASRDFLNRQTGTRLLVKSDESCSVMINEEDHLRVQTMLPGFQLDAVWKQIDELDSQLGSRLNYAFDDRLGFLTSCPTNVGTGMRASVMLHLPGLVLAGQIAPTIQGINKLNLAVRGIDGEGTANQGSLFQISNQSTLGESEPQILERLNAVIGQLIVHEKNARRLLLQRDQFSLLDHVGRSYGTLRHSYKLTGEEALNCLSGVRVGVDLGMFTSLDIHTVNELFIGIGAAHLQKKEGRVLSSLERDICRAALCREKLKI
ncbi:MAG: protein arginine kinase [Victivallales bacterium]|jgi:protein arginine kinase|nr:protein arginine kinase [Victivallales bacterium]